MILQEQIQIFLNRKKVDFLHFIDISKLSYEQTQGYTSAVLFGKALNPAYLQKVASTPYYVAEMICSKTIESDEFHNTELTTDAWADELAGLIQQKGYKAYSQSEKNIEQSGRYNLTEHITPLPHKTLALLAGLGWIGKNDLLISPKYGCAISMCTVLTTAPLRCNNHPIAQAQCGNCSICEDICDPNAIKGQLWSTTTNRDAIVNVKQCNTCFMCVVKCPHTEKYMRRM